MRNFPFRCRPKNWEQRRPYVPPNIAIYTYFSFLHSFCYRPFLRSRKNTRGITFSTPERFPNYPLTDDRRYMTAGRWLYANRLAKFIEQCGLHGAVVARISGWHGEPVHPSGSRGCEFERG